MKEGKGIRRMPQDGSPQLRKFPCTNVAVLHDNCGKSHMWCGLLRSPLRQLSGQWLRNLSLWIQTGNTQNNRHLRPFSCLLVCRLYKDCRGICKLHSKAVCTLCIELHAKPCFNVAHSYHSSINMEMWFQLSVYTQTCPAWIMCTCICLSLYLSLCIEIAYIYNIYMCVI